MTKQTITQSELKHFLHYCPKTGVFTRLITTSSNAKVGDIAGAIMPVGYRIISLRNQKWYAHRLAWMYVHGSLPDVEIDHINGNKDDNRIANLRAVTRKENGENLALRITNKSGFRGVYWMKSRNKWCANIRHNHQKIYLGLFDRLEDAAAVAKAARDKLFTHHKTTFSA